MKQLETKCKIPIYDTELYLEVLSHWNDNDFIVIKIQGKEYTILAEELRKAIENCTNTKII